MNARFLHNQEVKDLMKTKRIIGVVSGVTGVLILLVHLALMMFTDLSKIYHGYELWIGIGFFLAVIGIILIGTDKKNDEV